MGRNKSSQIRAKQKNAAGFVPESSMDGAKLSRWVVVKPYISATSSSVLSSPAFSSALSLYHDCWLVVVLCVCVCVCVCVVCVCVCVCIY